MNKFWILVGFFCFTGWGTRPAEGSEEQIAIAFTKASAFSRDVRISPAKNGATANLYEPVRVAGTLARLRELMPWYEFLGELQSEGFKTVKTSSRQDPHQAHRTIMLLLAAHPAKKILLLARGNGKPRQEKLQDANVYLGVPLKGSDPDFARKRWALTSQESVPVHDASGQFVGIAYRCNLSLNVSLLPVFQQVDKVFGGTIAWGGRHSRLLIRELASFVGEFAVTDVEGRQAAVDQVLAEAPPWVKGLVWAW